MDWFKCAATHPSLQDFHEDSNSSPAPSDFGSAHWGTLASLTLTIFILFSLFILVEGRGALMGLCSVFKTLFTLAENISRQQQPGHWKLEVVECPAAFVTFLL